MILRNCILCVGQQQKHVYMHRFQEIRTFEVRSSLKIKNKNEDHSRLVSSVGTGRRWQKRFTKSFVFLFLFHLASSVANALSSSRNLPLLDRVRFAMKLSERGSSNITSAVEACNLWADLLKCRDIEQLSPVAILLCLELQAASLVRAGHDDNALMVFNDALALAKQNQVENSIPRLHLAKAKSLQRLLRYNEAYNEFLLAGKEEGAIGAITCALRQGNFSAALKVVQVSPKSKSLAAIGNAINFFSENQNDTTNLRTTSTSSSSLLYRWLFCIASDSMEKGKDPFSNSSRNDLPPFSFLDYCGMNVGPFDEPMLIHLDDKVLLHQMLTSTPKLENATKEFWPCGWVVNSSTLFQNSNIEHYPKDSSSLYILKRRAGYGSHGNMIVRGWADVQNKIKVIARDGEQILVQRIVENPLLVAGGLKFSLRIYVAVIGEAVYISNVGLVKIAAEPLRSEDINERSHMTNSGREKFMRQETLEYIKEQILEQKCGSYEQLYNSLKEVTGKLLSTYRDLVTEAAEDDMLKTRKMISKMKIPKILGLDFVIDTDLRPWLVEVNRFPGLEPRDLEQDAKVKHTIVRDAWQLAAMHSFSNSSYNDWLDRDLRGFSCASPLSNSFSEVYLENPEK